MTSFAGANQGPDFGDRLKFERLNGLDVQQSECTFVIAASLDAQREVDLIFPLEDLIELRQLINQIIGD